MGNRNGSVALSNVAPTTTVDHPTCSVTPSISASPKDDNKKNNNLPPTTLPQILEEININRFPSVQMSLESSSICSSFVVDANLIPFGEFDVNASNLRTVLYHGQSIPRQHWLDFVLNEQLDIAEYLPNEIWSMIGDLVYFSTLETTVITFETNFIQKRSNLPTQIQSLRMSTTYVWGHRSKPDNQHASPDRGLRLLRLFGTLSLLERPAFSWIRYLDEPHDLLLSFLIPETVMTPTLDQIKLKPRNCYRWLLDGIILSLRSYAPSDLIRLLEFFVHTSRTTTCMDVLVSSFNQWYDLCLVKPELERCMVQWKSSVYCYQSLDLQCIAIPIGLDRDKIRSIFRNWYLDRRQFGRGYYSPVETYMQGDIVRRNTGTGTFASAITFELFMAIHPSCVTGVPLENTAMWKRIFEHDLDVEYRMNETAFLSLLEPGLSDSQFVCLISAGWIRCNVSQDIIGLGAFRLQYPSHFHFHSNTALQQFLSQ